MTESARQGSAGLGATLLPDNPDLLRRVIDDAAIGMALLDRHGRWIYANRALCVLLGRGAEACVGATLADVTAPEDRPHLPDPLQPQDRVERRYRGAGERTFTGLTSVVPLAGAADDEPQAILQIAAVEARSAPRTPDRSVDASREKDMERRLAALTERLEIALEAGGIGTYEVDFVAGVRRWDARTYQLHGVTPEHFDASLDGFMRLLHPDDVARVARVREAAFRDGAAGYQADYRVRHAASGTLRHIRASIRLIRAADGRVLRGVGACWDITDHVDRTARLRDTLALLEAVMSGTPDLIYAKDRDGRYLLANASVERLMGRPAAEIIGRRDSEIFTPEIAAPLMANDRHVLESGEPYTVEEVAFNGDVLHTYSSTKAPQRDGRGQIIGTLGISRDVTDMKAAEAALRQSELRWAFALEGSGDGIWDWDLRSGHVFYSRQWKAMLGYDEADIGTTVDEWASRVHPDDLPRCWEIIDRHAGGATRDFVLEHRMRAKDGGWRWIHDRGRVIERDEDGTPLRMIGTHTDITVRRESEDAILALNQHLQLALEAAGAGIFDLDFASGSYHWDERMYGLYDLPLDGFDGTLQGWLRFILADDVPGVLREYETAVGETSVFSMDFRIRRQRSGQIRHIRSLARVIRDDAGTPLQIVGMNWDITDHKELAEALFEEKERLRITLHSIGDSVIATDAQCRIAFMNPVAEQMTGWSAAEAAGRRLGEVFRIVDELSGEAIPDPVESCLAQMRPFYLNDGAILLGRDGERRSIRDSAAPVRTASGDVIGAVLVFQDVTKARVLQRALEHSASHDSLTGLRNRAAFERGLREARDQALQEPHEQHQHVLCFIDLDRFKIVNDSAGHAAGDALLREVANLLRRLCRRQDLAARLGGDEFALLLRDCRIENGESIARQFLRSLGELRFVWNERSYRIGASMGLTQVGPAAPRIDELMSQADIACYAAKTAGRNQIAVYGDAGGAAHRHHREVQVAAGIRNAIENDRFRLFAQEVRSLAGAHGARRHFEVLLRMLDDDGRIVEPAAFIPASERYDLMGNMDRWVIHTVLHGYGERLLDAQDLSIAINLSANSLNDPFLWPFLQEELSGSGLPPGRLHFEITETSVINNLSAAKQFLSKARAAGCGVVLDDFGTGLSSFTYLRQFPVSGLKIDGEFIRQMTHSEIDRAIVESINAIGHRLGAVTVAEQVEDEPTLQLVRTMGIDQAQGYAIARPLPLDSLF
jgi:diguanylate cyclase (GGDEF)-like protein/PAS domain S-box-containing protein